MSSRNKDEREVLGDLRSLVDRIVTTITLNFGAGGAVTFAAAGPPI